MQVDLEIEGATVAGLPRFQQAVFQGRRLRQLAIGLGALAGAGWVLAFFVGLFAPQSLWPAVLVNQSAGLLVLVAGLQSAWWVTQWREMAMNPAMLPVEVVAESPSEGWYERLLERISQRWLRLLAQIGASTLWLGAWALLVCLLYTSPSPRD